jgi:glycosyltransferase 2 family protein
MAGMKRRRVLDNLQIMASLVLLVFAWQIAGGAELLALLPQTQPLWLLGALAMTLPMQCLSAWRWRFTARRLGVPLSFRRALAEYYVASFLNSTLPSGVAGDAARVWRHGRNQPGAGRERYRGALHAVLLERAAGQFAIAIVLVAGLVLNSELLATLPAALWLLIPIVLIVVLLQCVLVSLALGVWIRRPAGILRQLADDLRRAWTPGRVFLLQLLLSLAVAVSYLLIFYLAGRAAGHVLQPTVALLAIPVVLYAMILPVSVGGLGLRELTAAGLWPLLDMAAAQGVLTALLYGGVVLAGSLPALAFLSSGQRPGASGQEF